VAVEYFVEEFLDSLKVVDVVRRRSIKSLWPEIEQLLLDDRRIKKTGLQRVDGGNMDCKYKFVQPRKGLYARPTQSSAAFGRSAASSVAASAGGASPIKRPLVAIAGVSKATPFKEVAKKESGRGFFGGMF